MFACSTSTSHKPYNLKKIKNSNVYHSHAKVTITIGWLSVNKLILVGKAIVNGLLKPKSSKVCTRLTRISGNE